MIWSDAPADMDDWCRQDKSRYHLGQHVKARAALLSVIQKMDRPIVLTPTETYVHPFLETGIIEQLDPEAATRHASTHARRTAPGCQHRLGCRCHPPHWVRCEWVRAADGERCVLGEGHFGEGHRYDG